MLNNQNLFDSLLIKLEELNLLQSVIIIGSWCLPFYKIIFKNSPEIEILRTMDIDILFKNPPQIKENLDLPSVLKSLDFIYVEDYSTEIGKFKNIDLDLDILINEKGAGSNKGIKIKNLGITAQPLRYLSLLENNIIKHIYKELTVNIPSPSAFTLHKILISDRRKDNLKELKDIRTACSIGELLLKQDVYSNELLNIFHSLPKKWQTKILNNIKNHSIKIHTFLLP